MMGDGELRQWCLERAFETRALTGINHMVVTNLAEEYYRWVADGESQASRLYRAQWQAPEPREFWIKFDMNGQHPVVYGSLVLPEQPDGFVVHVREVLE